jgi:hypothetical protein
MKNITTQRKSADPALDALREAAPLIIAEVAAIPKGEDGITFAVLRRTRTDAGTKHVWATSEKDHMTKIHPASDDVGTHFREWLPTHADGVIMSMTEVSPENGGGFRLIRVPAPRLVASEINDDDGGRGLDIDPERIGLADGGMIFATFGTAISAHERMETERKLSLLPRETRERMKQIADENSRGDETVLVALERMDPFLSFSARMNGIQWRTVSVRPRSSSPG